MAVTQPCDRQAGSSAVSDVGAARESARVDGAHNRAVNRSHRMISRTTKGHNICSGSAAAVFSD
jgi:hypothetical protein